MQLEIGGASMTEEEKELRACYHWTEWERKAKELEQENNRLEGQISLLLSCKDCPRKQRRLYL